MIGMMFSAETIDGLLHQLGGLRFRAECSLVPPHPYAHAYLNQQRPKMTATEDNDDHTINDVMEWSKSRNRASKTKCPVGTAVSTPAVGGEVQSHYDRIIHTVPPFYNYPPSITKELKQLLGIEMGDDEEDLHQLSRELLHSCYRQSFNVAFGANDETTAGKKGKRYSLLNNPLSSLLGLGKYRHRQQLIHGSQRVAVPLLGAGCRDFPKHVALEVAAMESASWLLSNLTAEYCDESACGKELVVAFGLLESTDAEALANRIEETISN